MEVAPLKKMEDSLPFSKSSCLPFSCEVWEIFYFNVLHFFHIWQAHPLRGSPQANPLGNLIVRVCHLMLEGPKINPEIVFG